MKYAPHAQQFIRVARLRSAATEAQAKTGGQVGRIGGLSMSQDGRTARFARVSKMIDPMSIKLFLKFRNCSSFSVSQLRGSTLVETFPYGKTSELIGA